MYGASVENADFPIPGRESVQIERNYKADPTLYGIALHHVIRSPANRYATVINEAYTDMNNLFIEIEKLIEEIRKNKKILENIRENSYSKNGRNREKYTKILQDLEEKSDKKSKTFTDKKKVYDSAVRDAVEIELKECDVIFCTVSMCTNPILLEICRGKVFQIIIDEAAMCTEPESIAAVIATDAKHVVLIGDHKQLRPVIMTREASKLGMRQSLFERYAKIGNPSFLKFQYRMVRKCEILVVLFTSAIE